MNANILQKTIQLLSFHEVSEIKLLINDEEIVIRKSLRCNEQEPHTKWSNAASNAASNAVLYTDNRTISDQISKVWRNYATNDNWPVNEKESSQEHGIDSGIRLSANDSNLGFARIGSAECCDLNKYKTKMCRHYSNISYNGVTTSQHGTVTTKGVPNNRSAVWSMDRESEINSCPYKDRCNYAHGEEELRCIYGRSCKNKDNGCKRIHK